MKRILVATDFSAAGNRALRTAVAWAERAAAALRIVHVVPPKNRLIGLWRSDMKTVLSVHLQARAALKRVTEALDASGQIEISTALVSGAAAAAITRAAGDFGADLVVVGARGEHEGPLLRPRLGGTSSKLLSTTSTALLLVRTSAAENPDCVLASVDLSSASAGVLISARSSVIPGGKVYVFFAFQTAFAVRLGSYGVAAESIDLYSDEERKRHERELESLIASVCGDAYVERIVERGDPADRLFEQIRTIEPSLIVLGQHARGHRRSTAKSSGSVALYAAQFAPSNVLIVPPQP